MTTMTAAPPLTTAHLAQLRDGSGISPEVIQERGYRSITQLTALLDFGFSADQCRTVPGLLIPQHHTDGSNGRYTFKPDKPRVVISKKSNKERIVKYENPAGAGIRLDCPPRCREHLGNPDVDLWITEGAKKADAGASHGLCVIALNGVWGFKGKNEFGGVTILGDWDFVALKGRIVNIVFDNDVMIRPEVRQAMERAGEFLRRRGAIVNLVYLPREEGGAKLGLDDYLLRHPVEDLQALVEAPRPTVKAAPAQVELLEDAPLVIARPLTLLSGQAVAAIWPYVKVTIRETTDKEGGIVRHNPPIEKIERRLMVVRGDGAIFGDGRRDLADLGADLHLPEIPRPEKLWSTPGVKRFLQGRRPAPADVFERICDVADRFIDFDRSLTGQRGMCEFIASYILTTWFIDAFNVIGYLWPNGEPGSGKTQLLIILSELGHLGQFILAAGSFAALRDLADYGALLCFDDAENFSDSKTTDPDKRMLLLAGNRRGSTIPVKEQGPDGAWRTRHVKTYCPRSFSATRLPDRILASRSITIPLVRSGDQRRANADPSEYDMWPHDRQTLVDDLWALAATYLPALSAYERRINEDSNLMGRNLEPWRAILAVALWLDENGIEGLADRIRKMSGDYQSERADYETSDMTRLVISAISAIFAISPILSETPDAQNLSTAKITEKAKEIARDDEVGIDPETINSKKVGWILKRLRLKKVGRENGKGAWMWGVKMADIEKWRRAYSLFDQKHEGGQKQNGENGENGEMAENSAYDHPNITPPGWTAPF